MKEIKENTEITTLYLSSWEYFNNLIIKELAEIVKNKGGILVTQRFFKDDYKNKERYIVNRGLLERINELQKDLVRCTDRANIDYVNKIQAELEELNTINNDPVRADLGSQIEFIIDNEMYLFWFDSNPFFDFHYSKHEVIKEMDHYKVTHQYYCDNIDKSFLNGNYYDIRINTKKEFIKEIAMNLFKTLYKSKSSNIVTTRKRKYYGSRYYYEYIPVERLTIYEKIEI